MMQHCLHLGRDKFATEGAATGFAVNGGNIFGSLGSGEASMYTIARELGSGRRGAFVAKNLATSEEKALKRYSLIKTGDPKENSAVAREIMNELRTNQAIGRGHPHIVQYENIIETERYIFVLMELVGRSPGTRGMDLFDFITVENAGKSVPEEDARALFRQMVEALQHLHSQEVVHGDIKPENCMVVLPMKGRSDFNPTLKLIDFGCACFLKHQAAGSKGEMIFDCYTPPEVLRGTAVANKAIDLYRLGATLYTLLQQCQPSYNVGPDERRLGAFCQLFRWPKLTAECQDLITKLLSMNPQDRPDCGAILSHPWLTDKPKEPVKNRLEVPRIPDAIVDVDVNTFDLSLRGPSRRRSSRISTVPLFEEDKAGDLASKPGI